MIVFATSALMLPSLVAALDQAYLWLCRQRRDYPADADVWDLRLHWRTERLCLENESRDARFRFGPLQIVIKVDGTVLQMWRARDALVLKVLNLVLNPALRLSPRCVHVKGHGGLKAAVREVQQRLPRYGHVLRTDVKGFYESRRLVLNEMKPNTSRPAVVTHITDPP